MKRINKKHLTTAILLAAFIALLLMQLVRAVSITSLSPTSGPVGTLVTVVGEADTMNGLIKVYFDMDGDGLIDPEEFRGSNTASGYTFTVLIVVPPSTAGTHAIIANDVDAGTSTGSDFTVTPNITLNPASARIGTTVSVIGTGFDRNSAITITFDGSDITPDPAPMTDDYGSFSASFTVAPFVAGDYSVVAKDTANNNAAAIFKLLGITISTNPTIGPVGTVVSVTGTQATPNGEVKIWWDDTLIDSVIALAGGTYTTEFNVPSSKFGDHTIKAEDTESTNTASQTFTNVPKIILSIDEGPVGTLVSVTGTGFNASDLVDVTFDTTLMMNDVATDSTGSFSASFNVPASVAGDHTITATDTDDSSITASAIFTVDPKITIDISEGRIGTQVQVTGTGFAAANSISLTFDGINVTPILTPETDDFGSFTATFSVSPIPAGTHTLTAIDEDGNEATAPFTVWDLTISIAPTNGPVGTTVTVTGDNATPEKTVTIRWDGVDVAYATAGSDGTYSASFNVPPSVKGDHTVTAEDIESTNTAEMIFTVEQQIILTPEDGVVGDFVLVTGNGFSSLAEVDVYFENDLVSLNVFTNQSGSFSMAFILPWVPTAGNYLITATDANGVTDDGTFTVLFVMYTRSSEYFQGDYPSFFIQVADGEGEPQEGAIVVIEVFDPDGYIQYKAMTLTIENGTVPYDMQFFNWWIWYYMDTLELTPLHLPSDATVGSWKWTATTTNGLTVTGSFEVVEPVDLRTLLEKLDQLLEGQNDIADLISYYGEKLQLEHNELAELIAAVSNELQLDHEELTDLINSVAANLHLEHEDIIALISEMADTLEMKLDALSTLVSETADKLKLDHEELANLISQVASKLQMDHTELASLVTQVFDALNLKLDDINAGILSIQEKVDGLYVVIGDLDVKLADINAKLVAVQNNIATIITDIGTIKTDISDIGGTLSSVDGRLATIETHIGSIQVDIAEINGEITSIHGRLVDITSAIGTIQTDISTINGRLASIEGSIATITTDLGTIKTDVSSINVKITAIEGRLATIETDLGAVKVDLEDIEAELEDINGVIATINTALGRIETKIDNLGAVSLEEIKADIATIKSDIGTIKVNVHDINANITSIKGRIATVETTLGTVQVDIDAINGRIEQLEGATATIRTDIGTMKVSLTDINAKITVINNNEATIQTDIGTIKGTLTEVKDNVATIVTDVGTVKSCTESIETTSGSIKSDTSWQTPTVALSLIAAIAAIAAAVLVLRKVYMK